MMRRLIAVLLVSSYIYFCDSATFETEMLIYRCHSYFRRVTTDGSYQQFVKQYVRKHCDSHISLSVLMISLDYDDCRVQYLYKPNTWSFYRSDSCANAIYDLRTKGLELAWGHPWGCPEQIFPMRFTKHFDVLVPLRIRKTMDFNRSVSTKVEFCGIGKKFTIKFVW
ncbi:hypothetical protein PHET_00069 [Paragonimus heterotremus]|uniref:Uncharacterized protein n=1 Tax=Paragonimus heterotremus TaxID=100268 RepID=A0A8J4SU86_9TREM|nr:hypothetical protein PHET_00069 [Paragonimus heterotremus]